MPEQHLQHQDASMLDGARRSSLPTLAPSKTLNPGVHVAELSESITQLPAGDDSRPPPEALDERRAPTTPGEHASDDGSWVDVRPTRTTTGATCARTRSTAPRTQTMPRPLGDGANAVGANAVTPPPPPQCRSDGRADAATLEAKLAAATAQIQALETQNAQLGEARRQACVGRGAPRGPRARLAGSGGALLERRRRGGKGSASACRGRSTPTPRKLSGTQTNGRPGKGRSARAAPRRCGACEGCCRRGSRREARASTRWNRRACRGPWRGACSASVRSG